MLREDYVKYAASVHNDGARFVRDCAAAVVPCCTLNSFRIALNAQSVVTESENLMGRAIALSEGLTDRSGMTKHTAVIEARMRMMDAEISAELTQLQTETERKHSVRPGTRGDIYNGYVELSQCGETTAEKCVLLIDEIISGVRDGNIAFAVPMGALTFMRRLCADYGAACAILKNGDGAELLCRAESREKYRGCLRAAASSQGVELNSDVSADSMAAMSSSGLIPSLPPVLFDILLRYERLPLGANQAESVL